MVSLPFWLITKPYLWVETIPLKLNRQFTKNDIERIQGSFVNLLTEAFCNNDTSCSPIDGATSIFSKITTIANHWDIAIATGGWQHSAMLKLKSAKIGNYESVPIAHGDDHIEREEIISIAIQRAKKFYAKNNYNDIYYVGDRPWDRKAAIKLAIGFIGIGKELDKIDNPDFFHISDYNSDSLIQYLIQ